MILWYWPLPAILLINPQHPTRPSPPPPQKPKNKTASLVGGIVGGVGGAVLLVGCTLAALKLRGARRPASGGVPDAAAFPAELEMSQPTSPLSPNTVTASPFLPATHPAPYSATHA